MQPLNLSIRTIYTEQEITARDHVPTDEILQDLEQTRDHESTLILLLAMNREKVPAGHPIIDQTQLAIDEMRNLMGFLEQVLKYRRKHNY